ncbi:conserved phage C-terminal domain-containing protein [Cytobacillus praedii]|uniref:conserved phage C-terminal domain-containing protein n=1 Tax=Cytobacillus praedii TaxID=1742358 RepID=UPI000708F74F|nr:conserved phage C-terminal domain-containing protein [Cytobacillus praedii]
MQRNYYAIIPANVRYDNELPPNAKLLYGEITALCNEKGFCWAGNTYFADLYNKDKSTIARWIQQLEKRGYITREVVYKKGTREIESRYMRIRNEGICKNATTPIGENAIDNNTSFNTTFNNTKEYIPYVEIMNYLNDAAQSNFRSSTKATQRVIKARWNEGFTLNDFKKVIDNKSAEWLNDSKMNKFLRPETLFGTKFESYLNQKGGGPPNGKHQNAGAITEEYEFGF